MVDYGRIRLSITPTLHYSSAEEPLAQCSVRFNVFS